MKFTLELDDKIIIRYAKHMGYKDSDLDYLNEDEYFKDTLIDIIENICEGALY